MMRSIRWQKTTKHGLFFKLLKKMLCVSAVATLYRFSQLCADSRTHANSGEKPSKAGETTESPQAKRRKWGERDLKFLQVKNKDGQDCLFVDLGKRNHKFVIFYPLYPELQINYKINRLSQWNVKSVHHISRNPKWHLESDYFVQPPVQNPKTLHLLSKITKKSLKSSRLWSSNLLMFKIFPQKEWQKKNSCRLID